MPSRKHQSLTRLLVECPELLVDLVRRHFGVQVPEEIELASGPETVRALGSERVADGTVVLRRCSGGVLETIIVEVQLRRDAEKHKAWAIYVAGTWARLGCPVALVVFSVSRSVARWAAVPIDLGHGRMVLRPLVLGPDHVPAEMSLEDARAWPEKLALSVLVHGHSGSLGLARTALTVARKLLASGEHRSMFLADLLVRFLNERVRQVVEAEMKIDQEFYHTAWGKAYGKMRAAALEEGRSTGLEEGRSEGLVKALWTVLRGRGLEPSKAQRERIERCRDAEQLEKWLTRASVADTVASVIRG